MKYVIQFYDENKKQLLGTDGTIIISGLKTLAGALNRMNNYKHSPRARYFKAFRTHNIYNDNSYILLAEGIVT